MAWLLLIYLAPMSSKEGDSRPEIPALLLLLALLALVGLELWTIVHHIGKLF